MSEPSRGRLWRDRALIVGVPCAVGAILVSVRWLEMRGLVASRPLLTGLALLNVAFAFGGRPAARS